MNFLVTCSGDLLNVMKMVRTIIKYIQIIVPIALILWGSIDMLKAVIAGDEKKMKEARKPFIQRLVSAIIVFLIPFIVNMAINLVVSGTSDWKSCWNDASGDYTKIDTTEKLE